MKALFKSFWFWAAVAMFVVALLVWYQPRVESFLAWVKLKTIGPATNRPNAPGELAAAPVQTGTTIYERTVPSSVGAPSAPYMGPV